MCYGYRTTVEGGLIIYPVEAIYIFHIFERFAAGDSLGKISASLARMNVLSPTGKEVWSKETILKILNNEKYTGGVILQKTFVENYLEHKQIKNNGQIGMCHMFSNHEAIVRTCMYNQRMPDARGIFRAGKAILAGILPYGKENERSLPEKAPGRSCSMVVHTGS